MFRGLSVCPDAITTSGSIQKAIMLWAPQKLHLCIIHVRTIRSSLGWYLQWGTPWPLKGKPLSQAIALSLSNHGSVQPCHHFHVCMFILMLFLSCCDFTICLKLMLLPWYHLWQLCVLVLQPQLWLEITSTSVGIPRVLGLEITSTSVGIHRVLGW